MNRRDLAALPLWLAGVPAFAQAGADGQKILRVSFPTAETGFDPAQTYDVYSRTVTAHIFEALYRYDHLARPARIRPHTAVDMPEVDADWRTWTIRIRPGIRFQDDPAFNGQPRELVAADFVYAWKRFVDPAYKSPAVAEILEVGFLGLAELRQKALDAGGGLDYDQSIDGLQAVDRHTLRIRLKEPRPRLLELLAQNSQMGAVAREVVERYAADIMAHPVGTGPFRLTQWRRASRMVLERNPSYREVFYDEQPTPGDAPAEAIAKQLAGRRLPMVDRVEISVIEESQPNWLAFLNQQLDVVAVPGEFIPQATQHGRLAPALERQGIRLTRTLNPDSVYLYFDMRDSLLGGMGPAQVALRRAMGLAIESQRLIDRMYRSQAIRAQSPITPHATGYDPAFKSEMGDHDPARAKALLDLYGFVDRDGDGVRETPQGQPLRITMGTQSDQFSRGMTEILQKNLAAVGIALQFNVAQWSEQLKAARAGKLQMWSLGGTATAPDGLGSLARYQSSQAGAQNFARFSLPEVDALYAKLQRLPDGPEREAAFLEFKRYAVAYMPYKPLLHRIASDLTWPWLIGHRRPLFWRDWYQFVDLAPREAA
jgi:ABC-type transport system substrate-binding protein